MRAVEQVKMLLSSTMDQFLKDLKAADDVFAFELMQQVFEKTLYLFDRMMFADLGLITQIAAGFTQRGNTDVVPGMAARYSPVCKKFLALMVVLQREVDHRHITSVLAADRIFYDNIAELLRTSSPTLEELHDSIRKRDAARQDILHQKDNVVRHILQKNADNNSLVLSQIFPDS